MSIIEVQGDLLKSDCQVIAHGCNCYAVWGAGIAKQIKELYPFAYDADRDFLFKSPVRDKLGNISFSRVWKEDGSLKSDCFVYNLYTQLGYGRDRVYVDYDAVMSSFILMKLNLKQNPLWFYDDVKIGIPKIGCGLAGGNWELVKSIIEFVNSKRMNIPTAAKLLSNVRLKDFLLIEENPLPKSCRTTS